MTPELEPVLRTEHFLARIAGDPGVVLNPETREEIFLQRIIDTGGGGGGSVTVDDELSLSSENPVQNKVITAALGNKADTTALNDYEQKPTVATDLSSTSITLEAAANTVYNYGTLTSLTVSSFPASGEFLIVFASGSTPTTLSLPNDLDARMPSGFTVEADTHYEISVRNGWPMVGSCPIPPAT